MLHGNMIYRIVITAVNGKSSIFRRKREAPPLAESGACDSADVKCAREREPGKYGSVRLR